MKTWIRFIKEEKGIGTVEMILIRGIDLSGDHL